MDNNNKKIKKINKMRNEIFEFETTGEMQLSAVVSKYVINDFSGVREHGEEIALVVSGYNSRKEIEIEEEITLSFEEAKKLANTINMMISSTNQ